MGAQTCGEARTGTPLKMGWAVCGSHWESGPIWLLWSWVCAGVGEQVFLGVSVGVIEWGVDGHRGLCRFWVHVSVSMPVCKHARVRVNKYKGMCAHALVCVHRGLHLPNSLLSPPVLGTVPGILVFPEWEVAPGFRFWGLLPSVCPKAVSSPCGGLAHLCQLWGPADPCVFIRMRTHYYCSQGSRGREGQQCTGGVGSGRALHSVSLVLLRPWEGQQRPHTGAPQGPMSSPRQALPLLRLASLFPLAVLPSP